MLKRFSSGRDFTYAPQARDKNMLTYTIPAFAILLLRSPFSAWSCITTPRRYSSSSSGVNLLFRRRLLRMARALDAYLWQNKLWFHSMMHGWVKNQLSPHLNVFSVASWFLSAGLMQAINNVSLFPPKESCKRRVSFAFLYGMWLRFFPSVNALITFPSSIKLLLMFTPSENRSPTTK